MRPWRFAFSLRFPWLRRSHQLRLWVGLGLLLALGLPLWPIAIAPAQTPAPAPAPTPAPFNQLSFYPLTQTPPPDLYRPTAQWLGRLILPQPAQYQQWQRSTQETDWAWIEIAHAPAPYQSLVGKIVRLGWSQNPNTQTYVQTATRDVQFPPDVQKSIDAGRIHPTRLNGRQQVGPLQSLAGFRPQDDVTVGLAGEVQIEGNAIAAPPIPGTTTPTLRIRQEPVMTTGRYVALVKLLEAIAPPPGYALPSQCPGELPCASEFFRVQHYNPATQTFDGPTTVLRVPQQPPDRNGVFNSTPRDLEKSPAGTAGWYVYGAPDQQGTFTVQALKPRSLFQLKPTEVVLGQAKALNYIRYDNWATTDQRKGTVQSVLAEAQAKQPDLAIAPWQTGLTQPNAIGTRALVLHLFGSRGGEGKLGENGPLGTYTGHFAYGLAEVVRDEFTQEPQFDVTYVQVYANNGPGIMSGVSTWANYMGNLQRGKMGTHPTSDILVRFEPLTEDYQFGDITFSPLRELLAELSLVAARYRIGDGTGSALISAATSCVQDSNQALYNTLRRLQGRVEQTPAAVAWMRAHPTAPETQRFRRLVRLTRDLYDQLTPLGVVRWDWDNNADVVLGTQSQFVSLSQLTLRNSLTGLLTWRTALPRQGQDEIAILYLKNKASLWFLRSNQLGGFDPTIYPIAPTLALGAWTLPFTNIPIFSVILTQILGSLRVPALPGWTFTGLAGAIFGAIAMTIGFRTGFLHWQPWPAPWPRQLRRALRWLFLPVLAQELLFRVLLIPEPGRTGPLEPYWWLFALVSLSLSVAHYPLWAKFVSRSPASPTTQPMFLLLSGLLGLTCTVVYRVTGSLWTIALLHWLTVVIWGLKLGGLAYLPAPAKAVRATPPEPS